MKRNIVLFMILLVFLMLALMGAIRVVVPTAILSAQTGSRLIAGDYVGMDDLGVRLDDAELTQIHSAYVIPNRCDALTITPLIVAWGSGDMVVYADYNIGRDAPGERSFGYGYAPQTVSAYRDQYVRLQSTTVLANAGDVVLLTFARDGRIGSDTLDMGATFVGWLLSCGAKK